MKRPPISGVKLIIASVICVVAPYILEMIADGGPSHFGEPETGYVALLTAFFLWPTALILFLIGVKRVIFNYDPTADIKAQAPAPLPPNMPKPQVWSADRDDQQKPSA